MAPLKIVTYSFLYEGMVNTSSNYFPAQEYAVEKEYIRADESAEA